MGTRAHPFPPGGGLQYPFVKSHSEEIKPMKKNVSLGLLAAVVAGATFARAESLPALTYKSVQASEIVVPVVVGKPVPMPEKSFVASPGWERFTLNSWTTWARMSNCGGTVEFKITHGQGNLIFRNVQNCSNFDIAYANGSKTNYPNKKLQGENQNRHGSFTLPKSVIDWGYNEVVVVLKSNSGKTGAYIHLNFLGL